MLKRRVTHIVIGTLATLGVVAGCKFNDMNKKKVDDQNGNLSLDGSAGTCGTVASLGEMQGSQASILVQVVICGKLPGDDHGPWKALGLSVKTPTVYMHRAGTPMDPSKENGAEIKVDGTKVYAIHKGDRIHLGSVDTAEEGAAIAYTDGVKIEIGADGQAVDLKQSKEKPENDYDVFVTLR
jgi:hypothetical protein